MLASNLYVFVIVHQNVTFVLSTIVAKWCASDKIINGLYLLQHFLLTQTVVQCLAHRFQVGYGMS